MGSYEKEAVSHIYNPYDIRQRGIVKAQLEERIESDMQELAALNELETVSDEQQDSADVLLNENDEVREFDDFPFDDSADLNDKDYIGQIAPVYSWGLCGGIANGQICSSACDCNEGCCEAGKCVPKRRDWAKFLYCPAACVGKIFGSRGTCYSVVDFIIYLDRIAREFLNDRAYLCLNIFIFFDYQFCN